MNTCPTQAALCMSNTFMQLCARLTDLLPDQYPYIPDHSTRRSLLIETRTLPHLEFVIRNTILKLGDGWSHTIVCSAANHRQVTEICNGIPGNIGIIVLEKEIRCVEDYNNLCLDPTLWEMIDCEKVLVYQSDTFIVRDLDERFLEYDYIGAPWGPGPGSRLLSERYSLSRELLTGNGGLSIRNLSMVRAALEDPGLAQLKDQKLNSRLSRIPEDVYFSIYALEHGKVPDPETAMSFSAEHCGGLRTELKIHEAPFGIHKPWELFSSKENMEAYLEQHFWSWLLSGKRIGTAAQERVEGYVHTACLGDHWEEIFMELWKGVVAQGLYEATGKIHVCVSGSLPNYNLLRESYAAYGKIEWTWNGDVTAHYEYPTLDLLHRNATEREPHKLWYVHTKGVSADHANPFYKYWRRTLITSTLKEWRKHCAALNDHDTSGESWCNDPGYPQHYSGNFWWASSTYIRRLKNIWHYWENPRSDWRMAMHDRFQPEMWLSTQNANFKSFGVYNPIQYKNCGGIGFSHFIFHNADHHDCKLNRIAQKKIMLLSEDTSERRFKCRQELRKTGLKDVELICMPDSAAQRQIMLRAWNEGAQSLLIIRDDAELANGFSEIFSYCFDQIPKNWEMIALAYDQQKIVPIDSHAGTIFRQDLSCCLISRTGMEKLLYGRLRSSSFFTSSFADPLRMYAVIPPLATRRI